MHETPWPQADSEAMVRQEIEITVQVNGKVRGHLQVAADTSEESLQEAALAHKNVRRFLAQGSLKKVFVVPGKLVNIVVQ